MPGASPRDAKSRSLRIFLCHSSADRLAVRGIYARLQSITGVEPWLDEEALLPGQNWKYEIEQAVRASDVIIVCLSENSITKEGFVQREINHALDLADEKPEGTIFLIPVRLQACRVPVRLSRLQYVDYFEDSGFDRLLRSLEVRAGHLGLTIQPPIPPPVSPLSENRAVECAQTLFAARNEYLSVRSTALFEQALKIADLWSRSGGAPDAAVFKVQALTELASLEQLPAGRAKRWNSAMETLDDAWNSEPLPRLAIEYGYLVVDRFQDTFSSLDWADRQKPLRLARERIEQSLRTMPDPRVMSSLLAVKSTILRHLASAEAPQSDAQQRKFSEAFRCARLAVDKAEEPASRLELAESEYALSRHEDTDEAYKTRLESAEASYRAPSLIGFEPARFALPKFYRMTFRPFDACSHFPLQASGLKNPRRRLRDAHIYAEAAIQLWYNDYVPETALSHLREAKPLLEMALTAGFRNARTIIALAFTRAILDGPEDGNTILTTLCSDSRQIWTEALRIASEESPDRLIDLGFVLGMNRSTVWTLLGTYASRFFQDFELAEALYRAAVRLNPHNAVALTNLARFVVRKGDPESLIQARRLLQTAQQFADKRFVWWRVVETELKAKMPPSASTVLRVSKPQAQSRPVIPAHFANFKDVRKRFRQIEQLPDLQQRGYELEGLVFEIAQLTFDTAAPSYRIQRGFAGITQVDGYFEHHGEKYRVECKWKQTPAVPEDIVSLADKIDVIGVSGVLLSMNGFSEAAIERAKELRKEKALLLIAGDEIRAVVNGSVNFDQLMIKKRLYFDQRSEPYHRVVAGPEAA